MGAAPPELLVTADPGSYDVPDEVLRALATAHAVTLEYWDWQGRPVQVSATTVRAVLGALGVDATSPAAAAAAVTVHDEAPWSRVLPPTVVVREGVAAEVLVHVPHGEEVIVWVELEDGSVSRDVRPLDRWVEPREVDGVLVGRATRALPTDLPPGWHQLHARTGSRTSSAVLIVTPQRLDPACAPRDSRAWGLMTQLYQLRSSGSWGIGDLTDLGDLAAWSSAELGADFVLVNPLHAAEPLPPLTPSPYLPTTRRWANPLYLRVESIPEHALLSDADRAAVEALAAPLREAVRDDVLLDRDSAWTAKRAALELVRRVPLPSDRAAALAEFRAEEGTGLLDLCDLVRSRGDARPRDRVLAGGAARPGRTGRR